MRVPLSLIKEFIDLEDCTLQTLSETLTLLGIEVDGILNEHPPFARVVVGEIVSAKPHPNAARLSLAEVDDGTQIQQVVCGAPNCRAGIKSAFAKVGALLIDPDGSRHAIAQAKLRGVVSNGMLCSASELRLWNDPEKILELPTEWKNGQDLTSLLWDPIFELSLTPNLGHCLSARGIARELAAALKKKLRTSPRKRGIEEGRKNPFQAKVEHCLRYMCCLIEGVKIGPSPFWLQKILLSQGQKPISNVVDITNYILIKQGHPLHAFDADQIEGKIIHVGLSSKESSFTALDGIQWVLPIGSLLVSDEKKPIAIAGVIGGKNTAVSDATQNILLEAASFHPTQVRKTSKKLGLRTESALRFEKGVDPSSVEEALEEAAHLIRELCGGKIAKGMFEAPTAPSVEKELPCRIDRVNQILGTRLSQNEIAEILERLSLQVAPLETNILRVKIPTFRFDLSEEIDLIEEVARIYGYNNIERKISRAFTSDLPHDPIYLLEKQLRSRCVALGLQECVTAELISPKLAALAPEMSAKETSLHQATYAKTEEYSILRPSLLPSLLQVVKANLDQRNETLHLFEIGKIHFLQKEEPFEIPMAAFLLTGLWELPHWSLKPKNVDFYDLKGLLENLFKALHIKEVAFTTSQLQSFHPWRGAHLGNLGSLGEIHPALLKKLDIQQPVFFAEINLAELSLLQEKKKQMKPLPQYPSSERDWTASLPLKTQIETLMASISASRPPILETFELIDLYFPESAPHHKNATFRFTYRDPLKTISHEEVETHHAALLEKISKLLAK